MASKDGEKKAMAALQSLCGSWMLKDDPIFGAPIDVPSKTAVFSLKENDPEKRAEGFKKLIFEDNANPLKILWVWKNDDKFWYTQLAKMFADAEKMANVRSKELYTVCKGSSGLLFRIEELLKEGVDPAGYEDPEPDSLLPNALFALIFKRHDAKYVDALLKHMSKESVYRTYNKDGYPAYVFASYSGSSEVQKVFESNGYPIEDTSDYDRKNRQILTAAEIGDADEIREQLKLNANPAGARSFRRTGPPNALFAAIENENAECVGVLLDAMKRRDILEKKNHEKLPAWVVAGKSSAEVKAAFETRGYKVDDGSYKVEEEEEEEDDFDY